MFTLLFYAESPAIFTLFLGMSAATMVVGLVAALTQRDFRRVLSFNLVGHIGYTTASLSLLTPAALAGAIFYVLHHIVVITNLYLITGVMLRLRRTTDMAGLGGLYRHQPVLAALAMIPLFSLAGVPPLSGFLGKLAILEGAFAAGAYWVGGLVLVVGLLTLLSMARTWSDGFWGLRRTRRPGLARGMPLIAAIAALSLVTLAMTFGAEPLFELTSRSARQLLQRDEYMRAVLGGATLMLLGSMLLALAWAALQGELSLTHLVVGYVVGYGILAFLAKGGVTPSTLVSPDVARARPGRLLRLGAAGRQLPRRGRRAARAPHRACRRGHPVGCDQRRRDPAAHDAHQHHAGQRHHRPVGRPPHALRPCHAHADGRRDRREIKDGFERRVKLVFG